MAPRPAPFPLLLSSLPHSTVDHTQDGQPIIPPTGIHNPRSRNIPILQPRRGGGAKGGGGSSGGGKSKGGGAVVAGGTKITTSQIIIIASVGAFAFASFYLVLYCWVKKPWRRLSKKHVEQARRQQEVLDAAFAPKVKPPPPAYTTTSAPTPLPEPAPIYTPTPTPVSARATYTNGNLDRVRGDGQNRGSTDSISPAPAPTPVAASWGNSPGNGVITAPASAYVGYKGAPQANIVIEGRPREDRKETWAERWLPGWK